MKFCFTKRHPLILFLILLSNQQCNCEIRSESPKVDLELRLVQIVARHGARSPERPYPNDPFKHDELKYWPNGWGQLTEIGKLQQYKLGQFLRMRYRSFLSSKYTAKEVYVISSGYDRTIQSAQIAMAGLFAKESHGGSTETAVRVKDFITSSVPVHSYPKATDKLLQPFQECPRLKKIHKEVSTSHSELLRRSEPYKDLLKDLSAKFGVPAPAKTFYDLALNINTLMVESEDPQNLTIPAWGQALLESKSIMEEVHFLYTVHALTEQQKRLGTGPILTEIFKNMQRRVSGNETRKFIYYSGHDILLCNIMNTLGLFEPPHAPTFSSALIFELYQRPNSQEYVVKLLYKYSSTGEDLRDLKFPNCTVKNSTTDSECSLEAFSKVLQPYIIQDLENECQIKSLAEKYIGISTLDVSLIGLVAILVVLLLASQVYHSLQRKREYSAVRGS